MLRRAVATLLAAALALGEGRPAFAELVELSGRSSAPAAAALAVPAQRIPELAAVPALPAITDSASSPLPAAQPALPAALPDLSALSAAPRPAEGARAVFDGERPAAALAAAGPSAAAAPALAAPAGSAGAVSVPPAPPGAEPPARRREHGLKKAVFLGLAAGLAAPILYNAAPPLMLVFTAATAAIAAGLVWTAAKLARTFSKGRLKLAPRSKAGRWIAGVALGLALGIFPTLASGPLVETGAGLFLPGRHVRRIGGAYGAEVERVLAQNPEGRMVLDSLRDRGGTVRLPTFYVAKLDSAAGFTFPVVNGIFIDPDHIESHGWTIDEFLADPEKQRKFVQQEDELIYHELFHAKQFRKAVQPGQLDHFPRQLFRYLSLEMEYEAHIASQLYVHEKLKADPHASVESVWDYETFLDDLDEFLGYVGGSSTYAGRFTHTDSPYYRAYIAEMRRRMPAISVEGYVLLARRFSKDPKIAADFLQKARQRAESAGLPPPEEP